MSEHLEDLINRLAAENTTSPEITIDATLAEVRSELERLEGCLKQPPVLDPYQEESALHDAAARILEFGRDPSVDTRHQLLRGEHAGPSPLLEELGQYRLLAKLGEGGMGAVYKAVQTRLDRVVALKVLPAERLKDPQAVARFQREMRAVGKLQHPNIVAAHDAGEINGMHYLVMELVEGIDLGTLVSERGPLEIADACELIRQAALGLQHAHRNGLVHRDIKPSNLMLARPTDDEGAPCVKVLDLGLALLEEGRLEAAGELTSTGQVMGTIDYMAPEQGTDTHQVDIRADIYSLGATLYKLLTGRAPFADPQYSSPIKKLMALANQEPLPVTDFRPDCPPELARLLHQMLAKSPDQRPSPPSRLAADLQRFALGADLNRLLEGGGGVDDGAIRQSLHPTQPTAIDQTQLEHVPVLATERLQPDASIFRGSWKTGPRSWMAIIAALLLVGLLGAVIIVATDKGTVVVEAPDDLAQEISVTLLRNDRPARSDWHIRPGENRLTVRTGRVEIRLPSGNDQEFDLSQPEDLVVRRGKMVMFKVSRRPNASEVAGKSAPIEANMEAEIKRPSLTGPPPATEKPFVLLGTDKRPRVAFQRVTDAFAALQDGDTVEVHGNGPFKVPGIRVENKSWTLRAAPGYRPLLIAMGDLDGKSWIATQGGEFTLDGCDLQGNYRADVITGGGAPWTIRNCRLFASSNNTLIYSGPKFTLRDSFLCAYHATGIIIYSAGTQLVLENNILRAPRGAINLSISGGGQHLKLKNNTVLALSAFLLPDYSADSRMLSVEADGNVFDLRSGPLLNPPPKSLDEITRHVQWKGTRNLYCGPQWIGSIATANGSNGSLAIWREFWGDTDADSSEGSAAAFAWDSVRFLPPTEALDWLRKTIRDTRQNEAPQNAAPSLDWDLIGPGAAYVRALAQSGTPVPPEQLRPEPLDTGSFVIWRDGKLLGGYVTLQDASDAARSGDEIEIRTDGPFAGANLGSPGRKLRIRSAAGYRPVLEGKLNYGGTGELAIEGIHIENGTVDCASRPGDSLHLRNCSFSRTATFNIPALRERNAASIVNCWAPVVNGIYCEAGATIRVNNSVLGRISCLANVSAAAQPPLEAGIQFDRTVIWNPGSGFIDGIHSHPECAFVTQGDGRALFSLNRSVVESGDGLMQNPEALTQSGWKNERTLYRTGAPWLLDVLRGKCQSGDADSTAVRALDSDPKQWQLLPGTPGHRAGPEGRDRGAELAKIGTVARPPNAVVPATPESPTTAATSRPSDADRPFVLKGANAQPRAAFQRLADAVAAVRDGDTVEVQGNGPFKVPAIRVDKKSWTLRAARGYRPLLVAAGVLAGEPWISTNDGSFTLAGCDLQGAYGSHMLVGGGSEWTIRNSRLWSSYGGPVIYRGPRLTVGDSLICGYHSEGISCFSSGTELFLENNIIRASLPVLNLQASGGGQRCRMVNNTFLSVLSEFLVLDYSPEAGSVSIDAHRNIFDVRSGPLLEAPPQSLDEIRQHLRWKGERNLYCGLNWAKSIATENDSKLSGLEVWRKFWNDAEVDSSQSQEPAFEWDSARLLPVPEAMAWLRETVERIRQTEAPEIPDLGPEWDLIGPGEAYVRALAKRGAPVPPEQLRPEPPETGSFVVLSKGQLVGGHVTLQEALNTAQSGDEIEIRTDGPFAGADVGLRPGRKLTIRSAPGYRPVLEGDLYYGRTAELSVEAIHFENGGVHSRFTAEGPLRLLNCSFGKSAADHFDLAAGAGARHPPSVTNSWAAFSASYLGPNGSIEVRNSVLGRMALNLGEGLGDRQFRFERSLLWNPGSGLIFTGAAHPESAFAFVPNQARFDFCLNRSIIESPDGLMPARDFLRLNGWKNTHCLYRSGMPWQLGDLRTKCQSGDEGSVATRELDADPQHWKLLRGTPGQGTGPEGRDLGADVTRIGSMAE